MNTEKTIFEKIIAGEIPCTKIYEDDDIFAFLDIQPNNFGHTLVITKVPYKNIYELPNDLDGKFMNAVKKISIAVKKSMSADGINLAMNNDISAGQEVFHIHMHVIPRFVGDTFAHGRHLKYEEGQMDKVANRIIAEL